MTYVTLKFFNFDTKDWEPCNFPALDIITMRRIAQTVIKTHRHMKIGLFTVKGECLEQIYIPTNAITGEDV